MEKVEKIQYQAALAVTGAWQGSDRIKLFEEIGWESLSDRRICKRILQIHKIVDNKSPSYLREKMPPNRGNLLINVFREFNFRTSRYRNSFLETSILEPNHIPL